MVSKTLAENLAGLCLLLGFLSGLVAGWSTRERKAQQDEAYRADTVEGRMKRDGWSA